MSEEEPLVEPLVSLTRLPTSQHISFEELDEFVKMEPVSRWGRVLTVAVPGTELTPEMCATLSQAIKQSIQQSVSHDCTLEVDLACPNAKLGDDLLHSILQEAMPIVMRKAGRVCLRNLNVSGNSLTNRVFEDLSELLALHRDAKYRYKVEQAVSGCLDFSDNKITDCRDFIGALKKAARKSSTVTIRLERNEIPSTIFPTLLMSGIDVSKETFTQQKTTDESASKQVSPPTNLQAMSEALLSGLRQRPDAASISKSLLSLLHPASGMMTIAELESRMKTKSESPKNEPNISLSVRLHVFSPFRGAANLCGLELCVEPQGYRVVRVTEKPGQSGRVREGDLVTHIAGHSLAEAESMRKCFGMHLADGVEVTIERAATAVGAKAPTTEVVRELEYELMVAGAGVGVSGPLAAQQAQLVCQTFGVEGGLEEKLLRLKGPLGKVDQAMRQFCVLIVKAGVKKS